MYINLKMNVVFNLNNVFSEKTLFLKILASSNMLFF